MRENLKNLKLCSKFAVPANELISVRKHHGPVFIFENVKKKRIYKLVLGFFECFQDMAINTSFLQNLTFFPFCKKGHRKSKSLASFWKQGIDEQLGQILALSSPTFLRSVFEKERTKKATRRGRSMPHLGGFQTESLVLVKVSLVNVDKTVSMEFTRRPFSSDFAINLNGNTLKKVRIQRHLAWSLLQTCGGQPTSTRCSPKRPDSCTPWNNSVVLSLKPLSLCTTASTSAP